MREKWPKQMPLMSHILDHAQSKELEVISGIIDANAIICERILQNLIRGKSEAQRAGAKGMSAEQVLCCIVVKILFGFTYEELAFHIVDSQSLRWFCRISIAEEVFKKSALNRNIKVISDQTWAMINRDILEYAKQEGIEKGRKVRTDCTCVEPNIHQPWDSPLLVVYTSKDGRSGKTFDALDWLALLAPHIPEGYEQTIRYYRYYSNKSRSLRKKADADNQLPTIISGEMSPLDLGFFKSGTQNHSA